MKQKASALLSAKNLTVHYPLRGKGVLRAVEGVSLDLYPGEVLGLVGESGCGKTSLGRALIRLQEPRSGSLAVLGTDFLALKGNPLRMFRKNIQMVFQDPYASLNPRMTVFEALSEPLRAHFSLTQKEITRKVAKALEQVGLTEKASNKYPH
ncbi:ATP-binding cassette domain-containing protein, partial [bacterium]|nr:ATP-binding cassette domain-containing protein [bacterium]